MRRTIRSPSFILSLVDLFETIFEIVMIELRCVGSKHCASIVDDHVVELVRRKTVSVGWIFDDLAHQE